MTLLSKQAKRTHLIFSGDQAFPTEQLLTEAKTLELAFINPKALENRLNQSGNHVDYLLYRSLKGLELQLIHGKMKPLRVDFLSGKNHHRRLYGGGKGQALAKAIGLKKYPQAHVLDATAGLGRDAFVLASLGCHVTLLERSKIVHALLQDGLQRAHNDQNKDAAVSEIIARMQLLQTDSRHYLHRILDTKQKYSDGLAPSTDEEHKNKMDTIPTQPDIIYLDPMFPPRLKSAQVKKEMFLFHKLIGADQDSHTLLSLARKCATYRVVVKRPAKASSLGLAKAHFSLVGKSTRYDIYLPD